MSELTEDQKKELQSRGISFKTFEQQMENFKSGFPFLKIIDAATLNNGIVQISEQEQAESVACNVFDGVICKFVPASGAATRMFKDLFEALEVLNRGEQLKENSKTAMFFKYFFKFPFLNNKNLLCLVLSDKGLNYGSTPKGLIEFHAYKDKSRTAFEEHLVEGALYAKGADNVVNIVVTVSPEHLNGFKELFDRVKEDYQSRYNCKYNIVFTGQSSSTDIVAADLENKPFVKEDGSLLFRPAGHGALISNLNEIKADIIIVKNIDNVVREDYIEQTVKWKKCLVSRAIKLTKLCHNYLKRLDLDDAIDNALLEEIKLFLKNEFCVYYCGNIEQKLSRKEEISKLKEKLNRPIRVCGMVKNEGEPGGGPYVILDTDNYSSLQILEGAQIDLSNKEYLEKVRNASHFNPVDLVCSVMDYKGNKFNLLDFTDKTAGFISIKSYKGIDLKAQELPGLWNGAMSKWNTQFVEVPLITFNPVKTVLDLLRKEHLGEII